MKALDLRKIDKPYFGYEDIARALDISPNSAKVTATRYVSAGILIRIKRNLFVLHERWAAMSLEQRFAVANLVQVPSYISFMTALSYYEITTQIQQDFVESAAIRRSKDIEVQKTVFHYVKMKPRLYFGFKKMQGFFIAEPEKAFLDALYLQSLGRRSIDLSSMDLKKLSRARVFEIASSFPRGTQKLVKQYEYS